MARPRPPLRPLADLAARVNGLSSEATFDHLVNNGGWWDWTEIPAPTKLVDGGRLRFDRRRRTAQLNRPDGGMYEVQLGRWDLVRTADEVLTPGLTSRPGPTITLTKERYGRGSIDVRVVPGLTGPQTTLPLDLGEHPTEVLMDGDQPVMVVIGSLAGATEFCVTNTDGAPYGRAAVRTASGLAAFHEGGRRQLARWITEETEELARAERFAPIETKDGVVGVVFDCGAPGDYLVWAVYREDRPGNALTAMAVDLRRGPVVKEDILDEVLEAARADLS